MCHVVLTPDALRLWQTGIKLHLRVGLNI